MKKLKDWRSIVLIVICVVINIVGTFIARKTLLPFWLDAIGTLITAIELGPWGGAICGIITNVILGIGNVDNAAYSIVSAGIGISIGVFYPRTQRKSLFPIVSTAVFSGIVSVVLSTPLNLILYKGYIGNVWGDGLIDMLSPNINFPVICTVLGEAFVDIPDKALSVLIATYVIRLWRKHFDRRGASATMFIFATLILSMSTINSKAYNYSAEYAAVQYDTEDGLASAEINALAQTPDGYIWVGTYSGLYRCDGAKFESVVLDEKISNVITLFVDKEGKLWIGTNDSGLACYDTETKEIKFYTTDDGMSANAIRAITETPDGSIYVGTVANISVIRPSGKIENTSDLDTSGVYSMSASSEGIVAGVNSKGKLVFLKNGKVFTRRMLNVEGNVYTCVAAGRNGVFMLGTSSNFVQQIKVEGLEATPTKKYTLSTVSNFNKLLYSHEDSGYFYCAENGNGFMTNAGKYTELNTDRFDSSVVDSIVDYQGNIWFASNKQGVEKYSWNPFDDIFARAKLNDEVVNSVLINDGLLYVGMNTGLKTIDLKTYYSVPINNHEMFDGVKIKHLLKDSKGNIWVSTYGEDGLIEIKADGTLDHFNQRDKGADGGRFRMAIEMKDGAIVAATTVGIVYIEDEKVALKIGSGQGIKTQILSLVETPDGGILAGTDGDGVYYINKGRVIEKHYGEEEGLESLVVLKIVPCDRGYIFVTSNALYYFENGNIKKLNKFPYKNNYDVFFTNNNEAWVFSSAGIYIVNKNDLLANDEYSYQLLNRSRGLYSTLTANSHSAFDGENLYLCCADGVQRINVHSDNSYNDNYYIRVLRVLAGDEEVTPNEKGKYLIPAVSGRVQFDIAVLNYTLANPLLRVYLEGSGDDGIVYYQKEKQSLSYMSLPYGNYKLHIQVLDVSGKNVQREEVFEVEKESQIFERGYFKAYLIFVCVLGVLFIGWMIGSIRVGITSMERWQKEAKIDAMTGFWNKNFTNSELERICAHKEGALLMIDLDNFKLVNDLRGHEMGDKFLLRFAEILRSCTREDDFIGRIGGDEFIAFINGQIDENTIAEKARYLNEQIVKTTKELFGDDSMLPLGTSIGAILVPEEGTDYSELFRNADKALYNVKQNGKHGYAVYHRRDLDLSDEGKMVMTSSLSEVRMILGERHHDKGAYKLDFEKLQVVYRLYERIAKRTVVNVWITLFVLDRYDGKEVDEVIMDKFTDILANCIRNNDVIAPNGNNQVIVILTNINPQDGHTPVDRIIEEWEKTPGHDEYELSYEMDVM